MSGDTPIQVVAGVVLEGDRVLLCQRHDGDHLPLLWEFPGGKIDPGEAPEEALIRELREELGVGADLGPLVGEVRHAYPEKEVWLRFYRARIHGQPRPIVHRKLAWVPLNELASFAVPPPNAVIVRRLVRGELGLH